jgi:pimeloyl-ACP methyl ester carboxylesterase
MLESIVARATGAVTRAGAKIVWQDFGSDPDAPCVLLLPTWSIVHTDFWRHQVPALTERYRVVTFDGLGNGASDRPVEPEMYGDLLVAADAVSVLDACGVDRAAVIGVSQGGPWALTLAARHPERVAAAIFIAPSVPLAPGHPERVAAAARFSDVLPSYEGWSKWNRHFWLEHYEDFLRFFFSHCFTEPDSDPQIEHFLRMGLQTTPEVLLATAGLPDNSLTPDTARELAAAVTCPSMVIHGDDDAITPLARGAELARIAGSQLVVMPGSGHEPQCRNPDVTNSHILTFLHHAIRGAS